MNPVTGALLVGGSSALASSLMNKKKPKLPDMSGQLAAIDAAKTREDQIASELTPKTTAVSEKFGADMKGAITGAQASQAGVNKDYLAQFGETGDTAAAKESDLLRQRVLDAQKGVNRGLRENLAGAGQLQSGAGQAAMTAAATNAANEIAQGQQEIGIENLKGKQNAIQQVFNADTNQVTQILGIDENTLNTLMNSGREDLIREAQALVANSQNATSQRLAALTGGQERQMASDLAGASASNDLRNTILGAAGQIAGGYASRQPKPKPADTAMKAQGAPNGRIL